VLPVRPDSDSGTAAAPPTTDPTDLTIERITSGPCAADARWIFKTGKGG